MQNTGSDAPAAPVTSRRDFFNRKVIAGIEWTTAIALSIAWIIYHVRFFLHADGLWRDEVNSVNLAASSTVAEIWQNLQHDSFPVLFFLALRAWIFIGLGRTDGGLRLLGLLIGLAILGILWMNARRFRFPTPIAALTLLGFTAGVTCYGDSMRGYGLGILLDLLALGLMWDMVNRATPARVVAAFVVALASVHVLFYNVVILAAVCSGAMAVALLHRRWKQVVWVGVIGAICAASMAFYIPVFRRALIFRPVRYHQPSMKWIFTRLSDALGYNLANFSVSYPAIDRMWAAAVGFALVVALFSVIGRRRLATGTFRRDVVVYHLIIFCTGSLLYIAFLYRLSYAMQPWYFLGLLCLIAASLDGMFACVAQPAMRIILCLAACRFCLFAAEPVWFDTGLRTTGLVSACSIIQSESRPGDLVVLSPWILGDVYERYYHGPADLITAPPAPFIRYQNYDLLVAAMMDPHAMDPVIEKANDALRSGHRVFLLGDCGPWNTATTYPTEGPAPNNSLGWNESAYYDLWMRQFEFAIIRHAAIKTAIPVPRDDVSAYERPQAMVMSGWIDSAPSTTTAK